MVYPASRWKKRKPIYELVAFKAAFDDVDKLNVTGTALRSAAALGFGREEIVATIRALRRQHFYGSSGDRVGDFGGSKRREHAGEDLEAEIFLVFQSVGASLKHADLVVEALDEAERNLVLRFAVSGDAVPVPIDHVGEALVGFEALPFQTGAPVVEESARPTLPIVGRRPPSGRRRY